MKTQLPLSVRSIAVSTCAVALCFVVVGSAFAQDLGGNLFDGPEFGGSDAKSDSAAAASEEGAKSIKPPGGATPAFPLTQPKSPFGGGLFDGPSFGESVLQGSGLVAAEPGVKVTVSPESARLGEIVTVSVRVDMQPGAYTYPITDESSSTLIVLAVPPGLEAVDDRFSADREPAIKDMPGLGAVAHYKNNVTWSKRFRVVSIDAPTAELEGKIDYQVCKDLCVPKKERFSVALELNDSGFDAAAGYVVRPFRFDKPDPVQFQFEMIPPQPIVGEEVTLAITMMPDAGWHGLALDGGESHEGPASTIEIDRTEGLRPIDDRFIPSEKPVTKSVGEIVQSQHAGQVTWQKRFVATGKNQALLAGVVKYRVCQDDEVCLPSHAVEFSLGDGQRNELLAAAAPVAQSFVDDSVFASNSQASATDSSRPVWSWLGAAFLGGLILNVMPCVLPVLAIKIMSFVQQAGESRGRILALNLAYSGGVLFVFAILATLSVTIGLGFGEQFQNVPFTIAICTVVVVSALSLLGVFEIPIPGFLGNAGATHQEGLTGAYMTGVMATVLATPCTGPFIGPLIAWVSSQPVWVNYSVWLMMGVGMASPYLLAGIFPRVIEYLPRPGMWMVHFKQISGFILLGAVVFLMTGIPSDVRLHFLMAMVGVAFGCWIIGAFRPHEQLMKRLPVYGTAAVLAGGVSFGAYWLAQPSDYELPWQPFSSSKLQALVDQGEPVLVDFTADWCLICKQNERTALNVKSTYEIVKAEGVTTLYADFTHESPEIKEWLERFGQSGVPLTIVYPRGGGEPVKLTGPFLSGTIRDVLETATKPETVAAGSARTSVQ